MWVIRKCIGNCASCRRQVAEIIAMYTYGVAWFSTRAPSARHGASASAGCAGGVAATLHSVHTYLVHFVGYYVCARTRYGAGGRMVRAARAVGSIDQACNCRVLTTCVYAYACAYTPCVRMRARARARARARPLVPQPNPSTRIVLHMHMHNAHNKFFACSFSLTRPNLGPTWPNYGFWK